MGRKEEGPETQAGENLKVSSVVSTLSPAVASSLYSHRSEEDHKDGYSKSQMTVKPGLLGFSPFSPHLSSIEDVPSTIRGTDCL